MSRTAIEEYLKRIENGYYQVINGRIHRKGKPRGSVISNGYIYHKLSIGGDYAHRILFAYYNGIDELYKHESINHIDGNKLNNNPENLEGVSLSENTKHQWETNLAARGSRCSYAKLNENDVKEIRKVFEIGSMTQYELAEKYNVARSTIQSVQLRRTWKHIG